MPTPLTPCFCATAKSLIASAPEINISAALANVCGPFLPVELTFKLCFWHLNPDVIFRGLCISSLIDCSTLINSSSMSALPQQPQAISFVVKFFVMCIAIPTMIIFPNCLRVYIVPFWCYFYPLILFS